jgi:hypothetical protein
MALTGARKPEFLGSSDLQNSVSATRFRMAVDDLLPSLPIDRRLTDKPQRKLDVFRGADNRLLTIGLHFVCVRRAFQSACPCQR